MTFAATVVRGVSGELGDKNWRLCSATLVRGVSVERTTVVRSAAENWCLCCTVELEADAEQSIELKADNWRLSDATVVRGESGKLDDENWRLCSTTSVRGAICAARS